MERLKKQLIKIARKTISNKDPSHDINHALRVLANAEYIAKYESGNLDVLIPAALFHDVVNYPKDHSHSKHSADESASNARQILRMIDEYDGMLISQVEIAIKEHSYSNNCRPSSIESKILQDADRLEATGAIAIMRTFSSTGQMQKAFYNSEDPFCENRNPESKKYALDLFYDRLLKVPERMNTETAKIMANKRANHLKIFLEQLKEEIS